MKKRRIGSWVIVEKESGKAIMETFSKELVDRINTEKYKAVPILDHLQSVYRKFDEGR